MTERPERAIHMYPHRIRLHGPWAFEPIKKTAIHPDGRIEDVSDAGLAGGLLKLPALYQGTPLEGFRGRVYWRRRFHAPRSLEEHERLWLAFGGVDYFAEVLLNGTPLGRHEGYFDPFDFEVTSTVRSHNELVLAVDCPAEADLEHRRLIRGPLEIASNLIAGIWRDVALEVRSVAFLRDVLFQCTCEDARGRIIATGRVVGEPGVRLSLELSSDGKLLAAQPVEATSSGTTFRLDGCLDAVARWSPAAEPRAKTYSVRLDLHGLARTLDAVERRVGFRTFSIDQDLRSAALNGVRFPVQFRSMGCDSLARMMSGSVHPVLPPRPERPDVLVVTRLHGVVATQVYDRADREGWLLWQDFPLCGKHSEDDRFSSEACRQAVAMVRQLGFHPSILGWSCRMAESQPNHVLDSAIQQAMGIDLRFEI